MVFTTGGLGLGLKVIWPWENADDTEVSREFIEWNGFRSLH